MINKRPSRLAKDNTSALDVYLYCLEKYEKNINKKPLFVFFYLQPLLGISII